VNEEYYETGYQARIVDVRYACAKGGLGGLISPLWKHYMKNEARFNIDD
jgi:hypothetical protein